MSIPIKGEEPGAFVLTSKHDGKKYVMTEKTLREMLRRLGEENFDKFFTGEWVVLNEKERKLAEDMAKEIRRNYYDEPLLSG